MKIQNYTAYSQLFIASNNGNLDDFLSGFKEALNQFIFDELKEFDLSLLSSTLPAHEFVETLANLADDYSYLSEHNWLGRLENQGYYDENDGYVEEDSYEEICAGIVEDLGATLLLPALADQLEADQLQAISIDSNLITLSFQTKNHSIQLMVELSGECPYCIEIDIDGVGKRYEDHIYLGSINELLDDSCFTKCLEIVNESTGSKIDVQTALLAKFNPLRFSPNSLAQHIYCYHNESVYKDLVLSLQQHGESALLNNPLNVMLENPHFLKNLCLQIAKIDDADPIDVMQLISNSKGPDVAQGFIDTYFVTHMAKVGRSIDLSLVSLCTESVQSKVFQSCCNEIAQNITVHQQPGKFAIPYQPSFELESEVPTP
ncbi:hypothetical protein [Shewanella colwelliana]|uniref:hypothetical protein n=1 Tax=Shewanella colwelliana TaxID=23 RepID=UPI0022AEF10D|nr:hypothetical protein [Shewanella colwelliana]MCZ4337821.1 hypothetical protein [Shewanella colwelliana]